MNAGSMRDPLCPPRAPPSDDRQRPSATSNQLVNDRHRRDRIMQSAAAIGSRWMSHLQLAQLGSKQWSCPRTVLPISVGIGTIRAVRHLVPRDIVLDAAVRDGEAHTLQSLSDRSGSSKQGLSCARSLFFSKPASNAIDLWSPGTTKWSTTLVSMYCRCSNASASRRTSSMAEFPSYLRETLVGVDVQCAQSWWLAVISTASATT